MQSARILRQFELVAISLVMALSLCPGCQGNDSHSSIATFRADSARSGFYRTKGPDRPPQLKWKLNIGKPMFVPSIYGGIAYLGVGDEAVLGIDAKKGQILWKYDTKGRTLSPTIADGLIYVRVYDRFGVNTSFHVLHTTNKEEKWNWSAKTIISSPAIANGIAYLVGWNDKLYDP
jgi:outer membrane protein assembly factor BamB